MVLMPLLLRFARLRTCGPLLMILVPITLHAGGEDWQRYKVGDRVEISTGCSASWWPATIQKIEPKGPKYKNYTIKRDDGGDASIAGPVLTFVAPDFVAPCVRDSGGSAQERAHLPNPLLGVYTCNYRGQIAAGSTFALLDGTVYRDYNGSRGTYSYDPAAKEIVFVTGPKLGYRARQESATTVQILDLKGSPTGNYCPHNPNADPNGKRL